MYNLGLILLCAVLMVSCSINTEKQYQTPQKVIIAGRIESYDAINREIELAINRPGRSQEIIRERVDSLGFFLASFESYTPTDIWVNYKTNFCVLIHPGDSIFIVLNGTTNSLLSVLESIQYSGDAAKINQDAATFQYMYYSDKVINNQSVKEKAIKDYGVDDYLKFLNTLSKRSNELIEEFIMDVSPGKETKIWASTFIEKDYYNALAVYPENHCWANSMTLDQWNVPLGYYDALLKRFPITESMLICGSALSDFINKFDFKYARLNLRNDEEYKKCISENLHSPNLKKISDSLLILGIIKHTPDTLARQMVLTELFHQRFERSDINIFENNQDIAKLYIPEPFLIEPLLKRYQQIKSRLDNPEISSDAMLKDAANSSANQIIDSILLTNKGKVIYLDFWATWCGPCLNELPHSKELMKQMSANEVAFVFLCFDSEQKLWKAKLDELEIGGQHYLLSKEQGKDICEIFEIQGIPFYLLIDKKGIIVEKGSHLDTEIAKWKIEKLLK